jgi:hypothetical protein
VRRLLFVLTTLTLAFAARHGISSVSAVTYPSGWNLVSGPSGSHLTGAAGALYTLQPGDGNYQVLPVDAALKGCFGYWAFFPTGGSLTGGTDAGNCAVTLKDGEWAMLGNPAVSGPANLSQADTALMFDPAAGYKSVTAIPAGQGAWVMATGRVSLDVPTFNPAAAAPTASATPAPAAAATATATGSSPPTGAKQVSCGIGCSLIGTGKISDQEYLADENDNVTDLVFTATSTFVIQMTVKDGDITGQGTFDTDIFVNSTDTKCMFSHQSGQLAISGKYTSSDNTLAISFAQGNVARRFDRLAFAVCHGSRGNIGVLAVKFPNFRTQIEASDGAKINSTPPGVVYPIISQQIQLTINAAPGN